jgi:hypothetical protein
MLLAPLGQAATDGTTHRPVNQVDDTHEYDSPDDMFHVLGPSIKGMKSSTVSVIQTAMHSVNKEYWIISIISSGH